MNLSTGAGLLALVLWSSTFALARSLAEQVGGLTAGVSVYLAGGCICLGRLWWRGSAVERLRRLSPKYLYGCGFLFTLYTVFVYWAVGLAKDREQLLEVALLNYLWPAGTLLLSVPLLGQRAGPLLLPGTLLATGGVFLVMTQGASLSLATVMAHLASNPAAYLLALGAALAWALYSNLVRRWAPPESEGAVEWFVPATGLVLLLIRGFWPESTSWNGRAALEALALGAITALAYALWDLAMRRGNLLLVAACSYFTPLLSTVVSCAYLKIMPGTKLWVGSALIVVGSLLSWRSVSRSRE